MLARHSLIYGSTSVISGIIGFLLIAVYTRLLSPADYGDYSLLIATVSFVDASVFLWIRTSMMRELKDETHANDAAYISSAMVMYSVLSVACILVPLGLHEVLSATGTPMSPLLQILGVVAALESLTNLVIFMARIRMRHNLFFLLSVIKPGLALGLGALLVNMGYGVSGAVYGMLMGLLTCTIGGIIATQDFLSLRVQLFSPAIARQIIAFGFPLIAALSIQFVMRMTDRLLIETFIGDDATGLYAAAQDLPLKILMIIVYAVHLAAYPLAVKALDKHGEAAARTQLAANFTFLIGVSLPACVGLAVLAPYFAAFFVGKEFLSFVGGNLAFFTVIALINCLVQYYFILPFNLAKKTKMLFMPFVYALVVNVVVAYIGIRMFGVMGAALGSLAAYSMLLGVVVYLGRSVFPLPVPLKPTLQIASASLVMGAAVWMIPVSDSLLSLIIAVGAGAMVYGGMLYLLNVMEIRSFVGAKLRYYRRKLKV